jgi:SEC-C motif-containing protein
MPFPADDERCPCLSGSTFGECCRPILDGRPAPTAERLMRSRYTAFSVGDDAHLRRSWHPSTRPADVLSDRDTEWRRLDIMATTAGGPFDREGTVEFRAVWRDASGRGVLHERSRFVREGREWLYVDGDVLG